MKLVSIALPLGFLVVCVGCPSQTVPPKPAVPPAAQAPAVTSPAEPASPLATPPAAASDPATATPATPDASSLPAGSLGLAPAQQPILAPAAADVAPDYVLGPEDGLNVNVWKDPTLSGTLTIRPDGKITLGLLGDLQAAGVKPMDLAATITEKLKKYIQDPVVTVTVTGINSKRIFFIGEVMHPGPIPMTREFSMLQAISAAGGLTPYANRKKIIVQRMVNGKEQRLFYNYSKALKTGDEQGIKPLAGDTVIVQ